MERVTRKGSKGRGSNRFFLALLLLGMPVVAEAGPSLRLRAQVARPLETSNGVNPTAANQKKGRDLFIRDCAHCHGKIGDGNSPVRGTLHPAPLDLTRFDFTDSFILQVLHEGVSGSDMPAWHSSVEEDLRAVSAYTARLGHSDQLPETDRFAPPEALQEAGKRIYAMHCARCHGERGIGDGNDAVRYVPSPPSFQGMRPSYAIAKQVIKRGVLGTSMPSWPLLTPPEVQAVTYYIRSLYAGGRREPFSKTGSTPSVTR